MLHCVLTKAKDPVVGIAEENRGCLGIDLGEAQNQLGRPGGEQAAGKTGKSLTQNFFAKGGFAGRKHDSCML